MLAAVVVGAGASTAARTELDTLPETVLAPNALFPDPFFLKEDLKNGTDDLFRPLEASTPEDVFANCTAYMGR